MLLYVCDIKQEDRVQNSSLIFGKLPAVFRPQE